MDSKSIIIKILDREFSLKVSSEQEPLLREAADRVFHNANQKRRQYGISDSTDLLSMLLFDAMVEVVNHEQTLDKAHQKLKSIEKKLHI